MHGCQRQAQTVPLHHTPRGERRQVFDILAIGRLLSRLNPTQVVTGLAAWHVLKCTLAQTNN